MTFTSDEQNKIDKLPLILRMALLSLMSAIDRIINGDCSDEEVTYTLSTLANNSNSRFADEDLVNYEESAKILGISVTNRARLKTLLDSHGIKQVVIHNQRVGFKRTDILILKDKLYNNKHGVTENIH